MTTTPSRPSFIIRAADVEEKTFSYPDSKEVHSPGRAIGREAGLQRTGVHLERIIPGSRTSFPHAEEDEEEWAYVLEGAPSVWIDGVVYPLEKGDFVAFPAGTGICHTFLNDAEVDALLLVGGERSKPTNRIFYPLHPERRNQPGVRWWPLESSWRPAGDHPGTPKKRRP